MRTFALLSLLLALPASAQHLALGDPITLQGVEVRGFRTRRADTDRLPRIQSRGHARIVLMAGGSMRGGVPFEVCGQEARRSERHYGAERATRTQIDPHEPSAHLQRRAQPAMTYVTVVLERTVLGHARRVTVEWSVPTARREELRAIEDAFFASIRCTP